MSIVAGVDFGTLSVRVSIFDRERGRLGSGTAEYPLHRRAKDPDYASQSHLDHMEALESAMVQALRSGAVSGSSVRALALDTTGSSVIMVGRNLEPLGEYYLWCDHRAAQEAAEITHAAQDAELEAIRWCGNTYSSEWGWSKLLHWLRHNPAERPRLVTALEHCDMVAATLCGIPSLDELPRSVCAMGHKWMWNPRWGGLPPEDFLVRVDPLLKGVRNKIAGRYLTSDHLAGHLSGQWAERLGLCAGIPIPIGALDAHWDAVGANIRLGDVVNVIGTSTCIIAVTQAQEVIPGVCGVVRGSVSPSLVGIEAGLSAVGSMLESIAARAGTTVEQLTQGIECYRAGQTGLLRLPWDNGDRTVLVNPNLAGVTFGWNLLHTAQDEFFAATEGTAFHTRIVLERMQQHGTPIERIINAGGLPQHNPLLNQIYANVLNKPIMVPSGSTTSLGSAIFAFLAAEDFTTVKEAQDALCPPYTTYSPDPRESAIYEKLFPMFRDAYFSLGIADCQSKPLGHILPTLRAIAAKVRGMAQS
jgi:L-ribulokinase